MPGHYRRLLNDLDRGRRDIDLDTHVTFSKQLNGLIQVAVDIEEAATSWGEQKVRSDVIASTNNSRISDSPPRLDNNGARDC